MSTNTIHPFGQDGQIPFGKSKEEFLLAQRLQIRIIKEEGVAKLIISHPLLYEGTDVEAVLMCYRKKNSKKHRINGHIERRHKKGWAILSRGKQIRYFNLVSSEFARFNNNDLIIQIENLNSALTEKINEAKLVYARSEIGIALRIPNPNWGRSATPHKNARYKGIPESLYGPISIIVNSSKGWGVKK